MRNNMKYGFSFLFLAIIFFVTPKVSFARAACLDVQCPQRVDCENGYALNADGCPTCTCKLDPTKIPTITPTPTPRAGCYYRIVQCVRAPCNPVLTCPNETQPTLTPTVTPTPTPRAGCYYRIVQCVRAPCNAILTCPTQTPTLTPRLTQTPTITRSACALRPKGDANCNDVIDSNDYVIWKAVYVSNQVVTPNNPDFNNDGKVNLVDLEIWTRNLAATP